MADLIFWTVIFVGVLVFVGVNLILSDLDKIATQLRIANERASKEQSNG